MINLSIVTVLYSKDVSLFNHWLEHLLEKCFYLPTYNVELILVNNCQDVHYDLSEYSDYNIKYYDTDLNFGYCRGNNFGIKHSSGDYILILNPDLYINNSLVIDWLYSGVVYDFGLSGMYRDGVSWLTYPTMFPTVSKFENEDLPFFYNSNPLISDLKHLKWKSLPFIDGCIMMFSKELFNQVQFDDDIFPGYFGENCFQFKCQLTFPNFKLINVPIDNYITHNSNSDSNYSIDSKIKWTKDSRQYFYNKYALPNYDFFLSKLV